MQIGRVSSSGSSLSYTFKPNGLINCGIKQAARGFKVGGPVVTDGRGSQFVSSEFKEELEKYLLLYFVAFNPDVKLDTNGAELASFTELTV